MKIKDIHLKNFRSFEDCLIEFEDFYTAICGKNNSGKSNIIRAILNVLQRQGLNRNRINYNSDFPIWKAKSEDEYISINVRVQLDEQADVGLIKFLKVFLQDKKDDSEDFEIKDTLLSIKIELNTKTASTEIIVDEKTVTDKYKVGEILRRIHFAQVIVFHNSTQPNSSYRRSHHGQVDNLNEKTKNLIEGKVSQINKELSKAVQKHKSELQELIGRLQEKYQVGLTFSGIDMDYERIPYEISLGEKNFELPLEDWGSGTKNRTLILSSIFNAKNIIDQDDESNTITPIVIIEEPESFLHPSAQSEFGRILQDLSKELEIQVIATTHSPYLLSHHNPKSNILVKRNLFRKKVRESIIENVQDENWREPFELALGMVGPEFESLKDAFFSKENNIILLEGSIDVEYFNLLRDSKHKDKKLVFDGEFYPYGGYGFLNNPVLLKFIKERFNKLVVTIDLDAISNVKANFEKASYTKDQDYFLIGLDKPGFRCIEGLLPDFIKSKVNSENSELIYGLQSENKDERKSAKDRLKSLYLEEFKKDLKFDETYFGEFYKLVAKMNKKLNNNATQLRI
ncbi:MAG: AAA family ATPase [Maribacter arcticus]|uniref:ATP-dependent nuclease n=1 Tax=Maribacter arcticus TaxID=561365 RepID=UPI00300178E2